MVLLNVEIGGNISIQLELVSTNKQKPTAKSKDDTQVNIFHIQAIMNTAKRKEFYVHQKLNREKCRNIF